MFLVEQQLLQNEYQLIDILDSLLAASICCRNAVTHPCLSVCISHTWSVFEGRFELSPEGRHRTSWRGIYDKSFTDNFFRFFPNFLTNCSPPKAIPPKKSAPKTFLFFFCPINQGFVINIRKNKNFSGSLFFMSRKSRLNGRKRSYYC